MNVKATLIQQAVGGLLGALPEEFFVRAADRLLDVVEDYLDQTDTPLDDAVIEPLIGIIRVSFGIPDNDP